MGGWKGKTDEASERWVTGVIGNHRNGQAVAAHLSGQEAEIVFLHFFP